MQQTNKRVIQNEQEGQSDRYTKQQLVQLLQHYCKNKNVIIIAEPDTYNAINNPEKVLKEQLLKIQSKTTVKGIIILNIDPINGSFSENVNHWIALVIEIDNTKNIQERRLAALKLNNGQNIIKVVLIDPMGSKLIYQKVADCLQKISESDVSLDSVFKELKYPQYNGNIYDCGPFLVETAMRLLSKQQPLLYIQYSMTLLDSKKYGQELRKEH